MIDATLMAAILDSIKNPITFADTEHIIRYMNSAAVAHYDEGLALIGTSALDCHNQHSQKIITEILVAMRDGEEERLIADDEVRHIYMRAVRDNEGQLLGYYERYEPPRK